MSNKEIKNNLSGTHIKGSYTGGDNITYTDTAVKELKRQKTAEKFALNARSYISKVAQKIVEQRDIEDFNHGLEYTAILEKLSNMNCPETYVSKYQEASQFFNVIDEIKYSDSISGGEHTVRRIETYITKLYELFLANHQSGNQLHDAVLSEILDDEEFSEVLEYASDVLIFYTIRECGIFNDKK